MAQASHEARLALDKNPEQRQQGRHDLQFHANLVDQGTLFKIRSINDGTIAL
jgi:hypothetical protein